MISRRPASLLRILPAMLVFLLMSGPAGAQQNLSPRLQIGINLLPGVLAANLSLNAKSHKDRVLTVLIVYRHDRDKADAAAQQLARVKQVRGFPLRTRLVEIGQLLTLNPDRDHSILMVEKLDDQRQSLIDFSARHQLILFSPFKGDVKKGVMAGFEVTNKVLPAINMTALGNAKISLKAFFLRIAVKHD